jgi:hypothetical protein
VLGLLFISKAMEHKAYTLEPVTGNQSVLFKIHAEAGGAGSGQRSIVLI